jgi:multidrug transporter EmrE-like cation transporter
MNEFLIIAIVLFAAFLAAVAQYIFKKSMPRFNMGISGLLELLRNRKIVLGLGVYAISLVVYLYALSTSALSFVYPTFASVFVFVLLFSKFGLGERISLHRALGVAIVIAGITIVALTY